MNSPTARPRFDPDGPAPASALPRRVLLELTPSEAAFQARVLKLARSLGWLCYHTFNSRRSEPGMPDLLLVRGPRLVFAELKVWPRTVLRPEQSVWIERLRAVPGVEVFVWVWVFGNDIEQEIADILAASHTGGDAAAAMR